MRLAHRTLLLLTAGIAAVPAVPPAARAQTYPTRPITMVVPLPAGGAVDVLARVLAEHMSASLGQRVLIENVTGAGGTIGVAKVAHASPDGYTLSFGASTTQVFTGAIYPVTYDLVKDFEPVALLPSVPFWIVGRSSLPAANLKELIAWLAANPGTASAATVGSGSGSHVCGTYIQRATGTRFQFVPYRGGAPAMQDLIAGHVDIMCDLAANSLPQLRNGNIKAYAIMAKSRWFAAPDVPTTDEAGLPGIYVYTWHGLWAPRGVPSDVVPKLNASLVGAMADPAVRQRIADMGMEIPPRDQQTPAALETLEKAEIGKWWPIIRAANIKGE